MKPAHLPLILGVVAACGGANALAQDDPCGATRLVTPQGVIEPSTGDMFVPGLGMTFRSDGATCTIADQEGAVTLHFCTNDSGETWTWQAVADNASGQPLDVAVECLPPGAGGTIAADLTPACGKATISDSQLTGAVYDAMPEPFCTISSVSVPAPSGGEDEE